MSLYNKSNYYLNQLFGVLGIEDLARRHRSRLKFVRELKKRFTADNIVEIYKLVGRVWPNEESIWNPLKSDKTSKALFIGSYNVIPTLNALVRHGMYSNKILFVDPLLHPAFARNQEFNPISNPTTFIDSTFKAVTILIHLHPWVRAGIAEIVQNPYHLNVEKYLKFSDLARKRIDKIPGFDALMASETQEIESEVFDQFKYGQPNHVLIQKIAEQDPSVDKEKLSEWINKGRILSPYVVDSMDKIGGQFIMHSSGLSYESAKEFCEKTNSYILTDSTARMTEIDSDRTEGRSNINRWTQIGFSVNRMDIKTLDGIDFEAVLKIRDRGYLDGVRKLMSDVWSAVPDSEHSSEASSDSFRIELKAKIAEAEREWASIDRNLMSYFSTEAFLGGGLAVISGAASFWPAMAVVAAAGALNLTQSRMQRKDFLKFYPAGSFIKKIRDES